MKKIKDYNFKEKMGNFKVKSQNYVKTNILFMRKVNEPEESLVTLEFKDNTLCQYKGYGDRPVTEEEDKFLTKWCKEKNIEKAKRG